MRISFLIIITILSLWSAGHGQSIAKNNPAESGGPAATKTTATQRNTEALEVLFATNEDCDLYINNELKGAATKSEFKYLKLSPGNYQYKAKSKKTGDELKESFEVKEGGLNEIFIDLLYVVDEHKAALKEAEEKRLHPNLAAERATINALLNNMTSIQGGTFTMGNNKAPSPDEVEHKVTINPVYFSKYEVTQQQWQTIMGYNPSLNKGCPTCPVENVSWEEAMKFIRKINLSGNKKFRLPTEAEWEYVARLGGKKEIDVAGGPEAFIKNTAWYFGNAAKKTHPVGQKQPSAAGVYDLLGNVAEWCSDWYGSYYYKDDDSQKNPEGPPLGKEKIIRGGSFNDYSGDRFRPSLRSKKLPTVKSGDVGFRLVMDEDEMAKQL